MHELAVVLGVTAALLHGVAFILYCIQTRFGKSSPKSASWALWAFLATLNALTFHGMTSNWLVTIQFVTGSVGCIATFLFAMFVWWIFRTAAVANMIIFIALVISFIPTYEGVWANPTKETPRSWVLWGLAFFITAINVIVSGKGRPLNLVMPIGGAILHAGVGYLSRRKRVYRFYQRTSTDIFF